MANAALSFVVVVWISSMLFKRLIEAKKLTILKGISNFFLSPLPFVVCICLFHICSTKVLIRNSLNYDKNINIFLKEVLYLLNEIYIYIYICRGPCSWLGASPYIKCLGFKGEKFKLRELGKKCSSYRVSSIL